MKNVARYDVGRIDGPKITSQGYLRADALATRTGVFYYMNMDGSVRRELRHPDEVFNAESMQTLANVVVTNDHPPEPLNADNTKRYGCGWTGDKVTSKDEKFLHTVMNLTDSNCIKDVLDEVKQEVSCGYFCDIDPTPGVWDGEAYDVVQRNIRYNHLAVVHRGRAGSEVKIQMDSLPQTFRADAAVMVTDADKQKENSSKADKNGVNLKGNSSDEVKTMPHKFKIDSVEFEVAEATIAQAVTAKIDSLETSIKQLKKDFDAEKGRADALEIDVKKRDDEIKALQNKTLTEKEILAKADALIKVRDFGKKFLGTKVNVDEMDVDDIKKAVVSKHLGDVKLDGMSADYVSGVYDSVTKTVKASGNERLKEEIANHVDAADHEKSDPKAARAQFMQDSKDAWKKAGSK